MSANAPPRRLSREARRDQLVAAALPVVARHGFAEFSLDEVAARAGVTRNLVYHYFPRGRADLALAVVTLAQRQLAADWLLDDAVPLADRVASNFERIADHALRPTHAWRVHRMSRAATDPELREAVNEFLDAGVSAIAINQFGTAEPPPVARLALVGFLAFGETVLDEARIASVPRAQVLAFLADTLAATARAAATRSRLAP